MCRRSRRAITAKRVERTDANDGAASPAHLNCLSDSTMLGVLTRGALDNGRGKARQNMFRHQHEVARRATASIVPFSRSTLSLWHV